MAEPIADVCLVGTGAVGGILAKELGSAGLKVIAFERGASLTLEDYAVRDAIRFITRSALADWARHDPVTFRNLPSERVVPRFTTINAVGGQMLHWTGQAARFMPGDFKVFTREIDSGVAERAKADLTGYEISDWPIDYDDLEPYYEPFEWEFGVSGGGGNPFAGQRKRGYPLPPLRRSAKMELFDAACKKLGYHTYESGAGVLSQPYRQSVCRRRICVPHFDGLPGHGYDLRAFLPYGGIHHAPARLVPVAGILSNEKFPGSEMFGC